MDFINTEDGKTLYKRYVDICDRLYYGEIRSSRFLYPNEVKLIISIFNKYNIKYREFKSHDKAERTLLYFSNLDFELANEDLDNVTALYLEQKDHGLSHRDILGSLMSLSIERELIGDILFDNNKVEISVMSEVSNFIRDNLHKIKHLNVELEEKNSPYLSTSLVKYIDTNEVISSLRLDNFVSAATNLSRGKAQELINRGLVKLDYVVEENPAKAIESGACVSIRSYGRFYLLEQLGRTRKDKVRILMRKML